MYTKGGGTPHVVYGGRTARVNSTVANGRWDPRGRRIYSGNRPEPRRTQCIDLEVSLSPPTDARHGPSGHPRAPISRYSRCYYRDVQLMQPLHVGQRGGQAAQRQPTACGSLSSPTRTPSQGGAACSTSRSRRCQDMPLCWAALDSAWEPRSSPVLFCSFSGPLESQGEQPLPPLAAMQGILISSQAFTLHT